jgi:hypothetical protein
MSSPLLQIHENIPHFGASQGDLVMSLLSNNYRTLPSGVKANVVRMVRLVDALTPTSEIDIIMECIHAILAGDERTELVAVSKGENPTFSFSPPTNRSLVDKAIRPYLAGTGTTLGKGVEGTDAAVQYTAPFNLDLEVGHTYKIHIAADDELGDITDLVKEVYVIVDDSVDYTPSGDVLRGTSFVDGTGTLFVGNDGISFVTSV